MIVHQDLPRQVLAALGIDDLELLLVEHELLDVRQRDVAARLRVVQAAVRVLLDQADGSYLRVSRFSAASAAARRTQPCCVACAAKL